MNIYRNFVLVILTAAMTSTAWAQLAKQTNLGIDELYRQVNLMHAENTPETRKKMANDAADFARMPEEKYKLLAATIYRRLGEKQAEQKTMAAIFKKHPKGVSARDRAFRELSANNSATLEEKTGYYRDWLAKFPRATYDDSDQRIYIQAASWLGGEMVKENQIAHLITFIESQKNTPEYTTLVSMMADQLARGGDYDHALQLLEPLSKRETAVSISGFMQVDIAKQYAETLISAGKTAEGVPLFEEYLKRQGENARAQDFITLAKGYEKQGRKLDAFFVLENFLVERMDNKQVSSELGKLYTELNSGGGSLDTYKVQLEEKINSQVKEKYKSTMIKKLAPEFSLKNMKGETVKLSDLKGKIVILDFWATWCGPCLASFPDMQQMVYKYQDDPEVEFLFIDCWQNEEDYRERVEKLMEEKKYNFQVLYDDGIKRSQQNTARAYNIKALPSKIFIDRNGYIRFVKEEGSLMFNSLISEITAKIEILKSLGES